MLVRIAIVTLSLMTVSAYPLRRHIREASWEASKANQVHDQPQPMKDVDYAYKSHIDNSDLYSQDNSKSPVADELNRKLQMESERLRIRLRQELAELRARLASARLDSSLASVKERLAPLAQQLQSSLSSNTEGLCSHLRHYLEGLDVADVQAGSSAYQEASHWMSHSSSKLADILSDFQSKATGLIDHLKENSEGEATGTEVLDEFSFRLRQTLSSVKLEAETRAEVLKTHLPVKSEAAASVDDFCRAAALQSQTLPGQIDRLFVGLEEFDADSHPQPHSEQSSGSLQEDFSLKLSALIQDILHSVQ